jgi:hypothetical protein
MSVLYGQSVGGMWWVGNTYLSSALASSRRPSLLCIAKQYSGNTFNPSGRISCPVELLLAQNLRYAYRVSTVVRSDASLAPCREQLPVKSLPHALRIMEHVWVSKSHALKTFPSTELTGTASVCTRMRRCPETVV